MSYDYVECKCCGQPIKREFEDGIEGPRDDSAAKTHETVRQAFKDTDEFIREGMMQDLRSAQDVMNKEQDQIRGLLIYANNELESAFYRNDMGDLLRSVDAILRAVAKMNGMEDVPKRE